MDQTLSAEEVASVSAKYTAFVTENLEPRLKELMKKREELVEEIESYEEVIHVAQSLSEGKANSTKEGSAENKAPSRENSFVMRKLVDIGCGVACQAESTTTDKILIDVGMGSFIELSLPEAIAVSKERQMLLGGKVEFVDVDISDCIADIEETLHSLAELKKVSDGFL